MVWLINLPIYIIVQVKWKYADAKSNTYIDSTKNINNKIPKFKIVHTDRISKLKNIFAKVYTQNWP